MGLAFQQLKNNAAQTTLLLRNSLRFNLKTHRKTKLRQAGRGDTRTLLNPEISYVHANRLYNDLQNHCGQIINQSQLRYLTVLHDVCELDLDLVIQSASEMRELLIDAIKAERVWALGVIEIEVVNLSLLKQINDQTDVEKRKLGVLCDLIKPAETGGLMIAEAEGTRALVHAHLVVDCGYHAKEKASALEGSLKEYLDWSRTGYQIRLEEFHSSKPLNKNLLAIAKYGTKGGNEELRYKTGFGRDLADDLDAKMFMASKVGKRDRGGETVEDARSLTVGELAFLDSVYERLMSQRRDRRGYLIRVN